MRPRTTVLALSGVAAAGLGLAGARLVRRATPAAEVRDRARAITGRFRRSGGQSYRCTCGARYRVLGTDRHRIYWPAGAPEHAPVLGDRCPECDTQLPRGREPTVSSAPG